MFWDRQFAFSFVFAWDDLPTGRGNPCPLKPSLTLGTFALDTTFVCVLVCACLQVVGAVGTGRHGAQEEAQEREMGNSARGRDC